jgi:predicted RNase H-like nuclease (RuvC/YqgF family)
MKDPSQPEYQQQAVEQRLQEMDAEIDRQRAIELRLQEMDTEINRSEVPLHPTKKHRKSARSFKQNLSRIMKISGLFLGGLVAVFVTQWLAWISLFVFVGAATWIWFTSR